MFRTIPVLLIFLALSLSLSCDRSSQTQRTKSGESTKKSDEFVAGTRAELFTMVLDADPESFDPARMTGAPEGRLAFNIFEGLMMPGPTTEDLSDYADLVTYGVAESHTVSEDGLTYTFTLREDAKWNNGDPLTAEDFVWSWERVLSPETGASYAKMMTVIKGANAFNQGETDDFSTVGVRADGERTLIVELEHPVPYFLELTAFYTFFPTPRKAVEAHGQDWTRPQNIITNGAYTMTSYRPQQDVMLEVNEHYWDKDSISIPKVRLRIIQDANAKVNAYLTGELHWAGAGLPVAQISTLITHPDYRQDPLLGTYYYRFNVSNPDSPIADVRVRRALGLAIDREMLVDNVLNGLFEPAASYVPPMPGWTTRDFEGYNVRKARELLEEAGFPGGEGFPRVELLYNTDENHKLVAEAIQDMWKRNLGIDVELVNKEWKSYLQDVDSLRYEIARAGWIGDFNDPVTFLDMWMTDNGNNNTGWSNQEYDALMRKAFRETDADKRLQHLKDAEELLHKEGPITPIYYYTSNTLVSRQLQGFEAHNRDIHLLKYLSMPE